jgi:hypothetical protein
VSAVAIGALTACGGGSTSETSQSDGAVMTSEAGSLDANSSPEGSASTDGASSPNDGAPTGTDGASIDGGACTFPTTAPAPQCFAASTILPSSRTPIASICASGDPSQPEGGVVPDGIYILTAREIYGTCSSVPGYEIGIVMCSGRWLMTIIVANDAGPSNDFVIYDYSEVQQGTSFVLTQVCSTSANAPAGTTTVGYTYSSGQLTLYWTSSGQETVETYVKD